MQIYQVFIRLCNYTKKLTVVSYSSLKNFIMVSEKEQANPGKKCKKPVCRLKRQVLRKIYWHWRPGNKIYRRPAVGFLELHTIPAVF